MSSRVMYVIAASLVASSIAVVHVAQGHAGRGAQKPVKTIEIHGDGGIGPVGSLDALWSLSPLVVDAVIERSRPADRVMKVPGRPTENQVWVQTAYRLKINEVFRDTLGLTRSGLTLEVLRTGGDRELTDRVESFVDPTFNKFRRGERYVLFLKPSRAADGTFVMATDSHHSAFLLPEDATVRARGSDKASLALEELSREELLNRLRMRREAGR